MRQLNWTKIGAIAAIASVIVAIIAILISNNSNVKTKNIPNIEQQTSISSPITNQNVVVVNPINVHPEEDKTQKIKTQIELYFLPFLSQKEFCSRLESSSNVPGRRPQIYSDSVEVDGHTGKASVESYNIDNGELRISCAIPIYSDYSIFETMKKTKKVRITDKYNLVASVIFIIRGDLKDIMENVRTKDIFFISPAYNKDTGRFLNELLVVKRAFEWEFLQKYFTEFKPVAENKTDYQGN
jgi:hypothetical protein